jgi:hypothetical protein
MRTKASSPELSETTSEHLVDTLLVENSTALLAGTLAQI